jgi:hypothetical protein
VQIISSEFGHSNFAETYFEWFSLSGMASNPHPSHGNKNIVRKKTLGWSTGNGVQSGFIYLGTHYPPPFITNTGL